MQLAPLQRGADRAQIYSIAFAPTNDFLAAGLDRFRV
jgi:hypothetical protein